MSWDQQAELLRRASIHEDAREADTEETSQFNYMLEAIKRIHHVKALGYGDYIKTHGDESKELFATQHFCDIKRKYVRAKNFIERMTRGETVDFHDLLDTYSDLAVYAVMGLQMAFHVIEKEDGVTLFNAKHPHAIGCLCDICRPDLHPGDYMVEHCLRQGIRLPSGRKPGRFGSDACVHGVHYHSECAVCKDEEIPF